MRSITGVGACDTSGSSSHFACHHRLTEKRLQTRRRPSPAPARRSSSFAFARRSRTTPTTPLTKAAGRSTHAPARELCRHVEALVVAAERAVEVLPQESIQSVAAVADHELRELRDLQQSRHDANGEDTSSAAHDVPSLHATYNRCCSFNESGTTQSTASSSNCTQWQNESKEEVDDLQTHSPLASLLLPGMASPRLMNEYLRFALSPNTNPASPRCGSRRTPGSSPLSLK